MKNKLKPLIEYNLEKINMKGFESFSHVSRLFQFSYVKLFKHFVTDFREFVLISCHSRKKGLKSYETDGNIVL